MSHSPYPITSPFGPRPGGYHTGVDFGCPVGTPIAAAYDGVADVRKLSYSYGWHVWIRSGRYEYLTAHMSQISVRDGQRVSAGTKIGETGGVGQGAGNSTGPHLHYEIRRSGTAINPINRLGMLFHVGEEDDLTDEEKEALNFAMALKKAVESVGSNASFPAFMIPAFRDMAGALKSLEPDSNFTFPGPVIKFVRSHPKNSDGSAKH